MHHRYDACYSSRSHLDRVGIPAELGILQSSVFAFISLLSPGHGQALLELADCIESTGERGGYDHQKTSIQTPS